MRRRRWAALIGLVAVLMHGGAFIYHNAAMLEAYAAHQQLLSDLGVLCHGGIERSNEVDAPTLPLPSEQSTGCLVCKGLISALAILPVQAWAEPHAYAIAMAPPVPRSQWFGHSTANLPPPARGPPV